jgi:hypothetical protein
MPAAISFSEKDSLLGTPASCRQLIGTQPIDAGKIPALPGNIYLIPGMRDEVMRMNWLPG